MNLFILRHGLAVEPGSAGFNRDSDRPLTPKGERKLWKIGQAVEELEVCFDWILSSPYLRARQTAEIIAEALDLRKRVEMCEALTPVGSPARLIETINARKPAPESVLLVGHEPYLSELISLLISGSKDLPIIMKKAGFCKLEVDSLRNGKCATLEWLLTPKQLCLMA
jgi:phosphohistidine phosphatase